MYNNNEVIDIQPQGRLNLRKKLSNITSDSRGLDSAIGQILMLLGGKSNPDSSLVTTRDSGCPELPPPLETPLTLKTTLYQMELLMVCLINLRNNGVNGFIGFNGVFDNLPLI